MFKNWKTTASGIASLGLLLAQTLVPTKYQVYVQAAAGVLMSLGLVAAKDSTTHSTEGEVVAATKTADNAAIAAAITSQK